MRISLRHLPIPRSVIFTAFNAPEKPDTSCIPDLRLHTRLMMHLIRICFPSLCTAAVHLSEKFPSHPFIPLCVSRDRSPCFTEKLQTETLLPDTVHRMLKSYARMLQFRTIKWPCSVFRFLTFSHLQNRFRKPENSRSRLKSAASLWSLTKQIKLRIFLKCS